MITKTKLYTLTVLIASIFVISCDDDNPSPVVEQPEEKSKYETGVLIVNEGGFGSGNGSVTWYHDSLDALEQNIFKAPGIQFAGDVAQSLTIHGDSAFLVLNGSNRIEIFRADSVGSLGAITHTDIVSPRYMEVIGGKAYISVWGPYDDNFSLIDSYVLAYDLATGSTKKIDTDEGTENLLYNGEKLFASNYNYGSSSTIAVINPDTDQLIQHIDLNAGPAGMVLDVNNDLWVITTGTFNGQDGRLYRINTNTLQIEQTIELNKNPETDLSITPDGTALIFSANQVIYKMDITSESAPSSPFITLERVTTPYALNVDPNSGYIYVGDALDFASAGRVYVYTGDGEFKTDFETGINPTYFVFR